MALAAASLLVHPTGMMLSPQAPTERKALSSTTMRVGDSFPVAVPMLASSKASSVELEVEDEVTDEPCFFAGGGCLMVSLSFCFFGGTGKVELDVEEEVEEELEELDVDI